MKKFLFIILLMSSATYIATAQSSVAIGDSSPKASAVLYLKGNGSQGLIIPIVANTGSVSAPEAGMVVYSTSDKGVAYHNGTGWTIVGSGTGGGNTYTLSISGNNLLLKDASSTVSTVPIAATTPTAANQFLTWDGAKWVATAFTQDAANVNGAITVNGIKGKALPALPSTTQALVYNGTAWVFQALTGGTDSQDLTLNSTTNSLSLTNDATPVDLTPYKQTLTIAGNSLSISGGNSVTIPGTTYTGGTGITVAGTTITNTGDTNAADDITAASTAAGDVTGLFSNLQLASGVVSSTEIADGTIAAGDLSSMSASNGQILKYNGSAWVPSPDDVGGGATPTLSNGQILIGNGTSNSASTLTGDAGLSGGALTISNNAITSAKIADGAIVAADLNAMSATNGQVLKFNGTNWAPAAEAGTTYTGGTGITVAGTVITNTGDTNAADDLTTASTAAGDVTGLFSNLQLASGVVSSTEIADGTIVAADLNAMSATNGQVLKFNGTNWAPAAEAGATYTGGTGISVAGTVISNTGDTNAADDLTTAATAAGDVTGLFSNLQLAPGVVSSTEIADGTIVAADLNAMSAANGDVLKFNGTNWAPAAGTGTVYTGGTGISVAGTVISNTGDTNAADDLTTASTAAGDVTGLFSNLQLASGTVTSTEIADGTITAVDLNSMSATTGQVLQYNGSNWAPAPGGLTNPMNANGDLIVGGAGGTPTKLASAAGFLRSPGAAATPTWSSVGLATTDVAGVLPVANGGTGGTTWNGLLLGSGATIGDISTGTSGQILRVAGTTPTWSNLAVISAEITDGTIMDADVNAAAAIAGSKVNPAFAAQNISTTGTATVGGGITAGGASQFAISSTGNITRLNNVVTSFPAAQGAANTVLINDGAGALSWATAPSPFSTNNIVPRGNGTTLVASAIQDDGTFTGMGSAPVTTNKLTVTNSTTGVLQAINATNSQVGAGSSIAVKGDASGSTNTNFALHGTASGGSGASGVFGTASGSTSSQGVYGVATGTGVTTAYGVRGSATSTSAANNYGVYGDASGGTTNWAGYFAGNTAITGGLAVGGTPSYGTTGQVLTSAGAGVAPTWTTYSGSALISNPGTQNIFAGASTGLAGSFNTFLGYATGAAVLSGGTFNTFIGNQSGQATTTGTYNTYIGTGTGRSATDGSYNLFAGADAGLNLISGNLNTFLGFNAGKGGTGGISNTILGNKAGEVGGASPSFNTFLGERAGQNTTGTSPSGSENTFVGRTTGATNTSGQQNTLLGANANVGGAALQNATAIGYGAVVNASFNMVFGTSSITGWGFGTQPIAGRAIVVGTTASNGNGAHLTTGGTWTNASDRNKKENFTTLSSGDILQKVKSLPITRWNYKGEPATVTHIGPMAQDFYKLFKTGDDDKSISTIDPSGVALLSIQELIKKIEKLEAENEKLKSENGTLEAKVTSIEDQHKSLAKDVEELKRILGLQAKNK